MPVHDIRLKSGKVPDSSRLTLYYMKSHTLPDDVLMDGYLSHTFSPQDAHSNFTLMERTSIHLSRISHSQGAWQSRGSNISGL